MTLIFSDYHNADDQMGLIYHENMGFLLDCHDVGKKKSVFNTSACLMSLRVYLL